MLLLYSHLPLEIITRGRPPFRRDAASWRRLKWHYCAITHRPIATRRRRLAITTNTAFTSAISGFYDDKAMISFHIFMMA